MNRLVIVGLGNPGSKYVSTRHNVGFALIDYIANAKGARVKVKKRMNGELAEILTEDREVSLFKPTTYMNASGLAVKRCVDYYGLKAEDILVLHDELDFHAGKGRLKFGGGHGGHNGLRDIHRCLGSQYWRYRIGISHPSDTEDISGYVLRKFTQEEQRKINVVLERFMQVWDCILQGNFEQAMLNLHTEGGH